MTPPTLAIAWRSRPSRAAPGCDRACARNGATAREARRSGEPCMLRRRCRGTAVAATPDPATRARVPSARSECPRAFVRSSSPARGAAERDIVRSSDARLVLVRSRNGLACARSALAPPAAVSSGRLLRSAVPAAGVCTIAAADDSGAEGETGQRADGGGRLDRRGRRRSPRAEAGKQARMTEGPVRKVERVPSGEQGRPAVEAGTADRHMSRRRRTGCPGGRTAPRARERRSGPPVQAALPRRCGHRA